MSLTPQTDGPDLSHWNRIVGPRDPAWQLTSVKASEGGGGGDVMFPANYRWAEGARWRGAFHWLRSEASIADQAANFLQRVRNNGGLKVGDILQTDWEVTPGIPLVTSDQVIEFNDRVRQAAGRDCVITYSSDWLPDSTLDADSRREFDEWRQARPDDALWYANYNTGSAKDGGWAECARYGADVWQWTSKFVHPSIAGDFDMNHVFHPDVLDQLAGRTAPTIPPITPPTPEDDMAKHFKCDDEGAGGAEFAVSGGVAKWIHNGAERDALVFAGLLAPGGPHGCARAFLRNLHLAGPAPTYAAGYTGHRTVAADFGSHG